MPLSILYVKTERNREYTVYECSHIQEPHVDLQSHGGPLGPASVGRHRLSPVSISIYFDKFMRAGYQQAVEMLNMSSILTQEGNKVRTAWSKQCRWWPGVARKQSQHFC